MSTYINTQEVFQRLRTACSQLLQMRSQPSALHQALLRLQDTVTDLNGPALVSCWEYLTFPLYLMLDSIPAAKKVAPGPFSSGVASGSVAGSPQEEGDAEAMVPAMSSDRVVEALLGCTRFLLSKTVAHLEEDQLASVIIHVAPLVALSPDRASEEVRVLSFQCMAALISDDASVYKSEADDAHGKPALSRTAEDTRNTTGELDIDLDSLIIDDPAHAAACMSDDACSASAVLHLNGHVNGYGSQAESLVGHSALLSEDLLRAAQLCKGHIAVRRMLRNDQFAPTVGYLIRNCLDAVAHEAAVMIGVKPPAQGSTGGSPAVVNAALKALYGIVIAAGSAEGLAFFLPGLVSGLSNAIRALSAAPSTSGSTTTATATAITCLSTVISTVFSDASLRQAGVSLPLAADSQGSAGGVTGQSLATAESTGNSDLNRLHKLIAAVGSFESLNGNSNRAASKDSQHSSTYKVNASVNDVGSQLSKQGARFRVVFTADWLKSSREKVMSLLKVVVPPLAANNKTSIRAALSQGVIDMLHSCSASLGPDVRYLLLDLVLGLAQDDQVKVSQPARHFLRLDQVSCSVQQVASTTATCTVVPHNHDGNAIPAGSNPVDDSSSSVSNTAESVMKELQQLSMRDSASSRKTQAGAAQVGRSVITTTSGYRLASASMPPGLLEDLITGLLPAVRSGNTAGLLHARKLLSALRFAGVEGVAKDLLKRPSLLSTLLAALIQIYAFDEDQAHKILISHALPGAAGSRYATQKLDTGSTSTAEGNSPVNQPQNNNVPAAPDGLQTGAGNAADADVHHRQLSAPVVPRMPVLALHMTTLQLYEAVAGVARYMGEAAIRADVSSTSGYRTHFRRVIDQLVSHIDTADSNGQSSTSGRKASGRSRRQTGSPRTDSTSQAQAQTALLDGVVLGSSISSLSWQCSTAAAIAVTAEILWGAAECVHETSSTKGQAVKLLESSANTALQATLLNKTIMDLPTSVNTTNFNSAQLSAEGAIASGSGHAALKELGQNALLVRSVLDMASCVAQCLGAANTTQTVNKNTATNPITSHATTLLKANPAMLRKLLIPSLQRLADPCAAVSGAATDTLTCLAVYGQFGDGYRGLMSASADYIVDHVCAQLRDIEAHPNAPRLLAVLLRTGGGVAPALLPVMAEPLSRALRGLSIVSRRSSPAHVHAFLQIISEVAKGAAQEGSNAACEARAAQAIIKERVRIAEEQREERLYGNTSQHGTHPDGEDASRKSQGETSIEEIKEFFSQRAAAKQEQDPGNAASHDASLQDDGDEDWMRGLMTSADIADADRRYRRLHSVAVAAGSAVDAATPLMLSKDLKVAVSSIEATTSSLVALAQVTPVMEVDKQLTEELAPQGLIRPVQAESPKILPAIAGVWGYLVPCLQDSRTAVVEAALQLLAVATRLGGGAFMARRFAKEAAPVLSRLLSKGTAHVPYASVSSLTGSGSTGVNAACNTHRASLTGSSDAFKSTSTQRVLPSGRPAWNMPLAIDVSDNSSSGNAMFHGGGVDIGPGGGAGDVSSHDPAAAGSLTRIRSAALQCITEVCSCKEAASAVKGLTWGLAQACLPFLACGHPPSLQSAAQAAMLAVAGVDPDTVWLLLQDVELQAAGYKDQIASRKSSQALLSLEQLLPPPPGQHYHTRPHTNIFRSSSSSSSAGVSPSSKPSPSTTSTGGLHTATARVSRQSTSGSGVNAASSMPAPLPSSHVINGAQAAAWPVSPELADACYKGAVPLMGQVSGMLPASLRDIKSNAAE